MLIGRSDRVQCSYCWMTVVLICSVATHLLTLHYHETQKVMCYRLDIVITYFICNSVSEWNTASSVALHCVSKKSM